MHRCRSQPCAYNRSPYVSLGKKEKDVTVSIKRMIPNLRNNAKYYTYEQGTLTIPPCSPSVRWIVLKDPITLSNGQVCCNLIQNTNITIQSENVGVHAEKALGCGNRIE